MVIATDRRTWSDLNGDDIAQDNEIGPVDTPFNVSGSSNRNADPDIRRPYQWEYDLGIQREVFTGVSLSANWVRRDFQRLFWTDNVLVSPEDYTIVTIANPLGDAAAETIPIYNLNLAKRGQVQQVDKNSDRNQRPYNGFDIGFTARVRGGNVYGGMSTGRQITVTCDVEDPNSQRFCDQRELDIPYLTQFKLAGSYPLPYGMQVSGSWQGYPGVRVARRARTRSTTRPSTACRTRRSTCNYIVTHDRPARDPERAHAGERHGAAPPARHALSSIAGTRSTCGWPRSSRSRRQAAGAVRHLQPAERQHS